MLWHNFFHLLQPVLRPSLSQHLLTLPDRAQLESINIRKWKLVEVWLSIKWQDINSLAPGIFWYLIFQIVSVIDGWGISCELSLRWMSLDLTDDKSTLVQVMAWCRQATSHYLSQWWPRFLSPNGVTRPQWVKGYWVPFCCKNCISCTLSGVAPSE